MRLGILGGAFNPPHIGHLILAQEAFWQLELDRVLLMPVGEAPHKEIEHDPGPEERYLMCELAARGVEWLEASRAEVNRPGPSFTVETLRHVKGEHPEDEFVLVLGADRAKTLPQWRNPEEIVRLATLAVTRRDGVGEGEIRGALSGLADGERVRFFDMPSIDVSSTVVRERAATGRPFRFFVPEGVADRIEELGLYLGPSA